MYHLEGIAGVQMSREYKALLEGTYMVSSSEGDFLPVPVSCFSFSISTTSSQVLSCLRIAKSLFAPGWAVLEMVL